MMVVAFVETYLRKELGVQGDIQWIPLAGDGSDRLICRVRWTEGSVIAVSHPKGSGKGITENSSYLYLCKHLRAKGIETPLIFQYEVEKGFFILEDLGDETLQNTISKGEGSKEIVKIYRQVVEVLLKMQTLGLQGLDPALCYQGPRYDLKVMIEGESGYFLREFLQGFLRMEVRDGLLKEEFLWLANAASGERLHYFLHRDFQSRNLMLKDGHVRVLDFQGGRLGPLQYDLASLVIDPYVALPEDVQEEIIGYYLKGLNELTSLKPERFLLYYPLAALHRNFQILGAFSFLSLKKGRVHFLQYIPLAIDTLNRRLLSNPHWRCPYLRDVVGELFTERVNLSIPEKKVD